jgi:glycosyltransferase XagB
MASDGRASQRIEALDRLGEESDWTVAKADADQADHLQSSVKIEAPTPHWDDDPRIRAENAAWRLAWELPHLSAHAGVTTGQRRIFLSLVFSFVTFGLLWPDMVVLSLAWALTGFFSIVVLFRLVLLVAGILSAWRRRIEPINFAGNEGALPVYSILAPMYRESGSIGQLIHALSELNYPPDKLDIKLVLEEDDFKTMDSLKNIKLAPQFEILRVPPQSPRTKPKALNFALQSARGDFVVIYDAEDIPDPSQLRQAVAAFYTGGADLACLQARLNYYNPNENWLTRQFTLEYSMWFDWLLTGLQALGLPIPLGGTSNHFRTSVLRELGGWDAYNVTEDADLGLRLARRGYKCAVLDSTTLEEANCRHLNWLRQRTRWQKGYMLTWLVHMRAPLDLWRQLGPAGFLGFQLFIGGTVALAFAMPAAALVYMTSLCVCGPSIPPSLLWLNERLFIIGMSGNALSAAAGAIGRKHFSLLPDILLTPFYWGMTWLASLRALAQLIHSPFHWEKTRHALSRIAPASSAT